MTFKTDENLPVEAAHLLQKAGFDCESVWQEGLSGVPDETIAACIRSEARVLVTLDLDFANIQAYPPAQYSGIIVLRPKVQDKATVAAYVQNLISVLRDRDPTGELWIVQSDRIRFRQAN